MTEPKWGVIVVARENDRWLPRKEAEQQVQKTGLLPVWIREENFDSRKFRELFQDEGYARIVWLMGDSLTAFLEHVVRIVHDSGLTCDSAFPPLKEEIDAFLATA